MRLARLSFAVLSVLALAPRPARAVSPLQVTISSHTDVTCNGASNGLATALATGGSSPYTYSWSPSGGTGATATGLSAGNYTVTVEDMTATTATATVTITQPTAITFTGVSSTNVACNGGANGAAQATATGGTPSYTYNWTPGNPTGDGTTSVTGLTAGTYTVTATDANACTATQTFVVTQPSAIVPTPVSQTNVACNGGATGAATVSASGGTGAFTYDWTPGTPSGDGTASASGLTAQVWTVTITDANSCSTTQTFDITEPALPVALTAASQTNVSCNAGSDGTAVVNPATGGTGAFTYDWAPGTPAGDGTTAITNLAAQTYTATATDANGCSATQTFTITQPSAITFSPQSQTNVACKGGATGAASITAPSGGTGALAIDWAPGAPTGDGTAAITGLTAQTYTATVTDANACAVSHTFAITEPASALTASSQSQTNVACNGDTTGAAAVAASGGTPGYTYSWNTGATTAAVSSLAAGTYTATVTDGNSCSTTQTFAITQPSALSLGSGGQTNVACHGQTNGSATVTASGGTAGYTYAWTSGDTTATASGLAAGTYTATVTDANSCSATKTFAVTEPATLSASVQSKTNVSCNGGSNGAISVNATGGTGAYSYDWAPGTPTGDGTASTTSLAPGTYTLTLTDANSCAFTQTYAITEPPVLLANGSSVGVSAVGVCDGSAGVAPSGGTGPYNVSWAPGGSTSEMLTAQCASTLTATVTDANACTATFTATLSAPNADLAIAIAGPSGTVNAGAQATYTITASTNANAPEPVVSGSVPTSMGLVSLVAPLGWNCSKPAVGDSGAWSCSGPTLTSGSPATFTLVTAVDELFGHGNITLTTTIAGAVNDATASNNSAQTTTSVLSPSHLVAQKTAVFTAPNQIVYTIVVKNVGPAAALDILATDELTDAVPSSVEVGTVSATSGTAAAVSNVVTWNGTLKTDETATITINTTVAAGTAPGATIANQASTRSDADGDGAAESTEGSSPDGVTPGPTEVTLPTAADDLSTVVVDMAAPADLAQAPVDLGPADLAQRTDLPAGTTFSVSGGGFGCAASGEPLAATSLGLFFLGALVVLRLRRARR